MCNNSVARNVGIDWLKVIAVFLVMNSHMQICYPKYSFLATGGAIGDALFFFASGFTLFMGRRLNFANWYKRRLNRIYPSIMAAAIVAYAFFENMDSIGDILLGRRYWFIGCIMVYYILFYPIIAIKEGAYAPKALMGAGAICVVLYFFFFNDGTIFYGEGNFRCFAYFLIMLQGGLMGRKVKELQFKKTHVLLLILSVGIFYTLMFIGKGSPLILLSFVPLMGVTRYCYLCSSALLLSRFYKNNVVGNVVYIVSQCCLEVYLIQKYIFTDSLNHLFPLNIPVVMLTVLLAAYIVKTIAEFISQTFKTELYDWGRMLIHR